MNGQTDGWTDRWTDGRWVGAVMSVSGWMNEQMGRQMSEWKEKRTDSKRASEMISVQINGWEERKVEGKCVQSNCPVLFYFVLF